MTSKTQQVAQKKESGIFDFISAVLELLASLLDVL